MERPGTTRTRVLGVGLLAVVALAFGWVGAVEPTARAALHLVLLALLVTASTLPRDRLRKASDTTFRATLAVMPLVLAASVGLMPVPDSVAELIAPGLIEAFPEEPWWTAAVSPEQVIYSIAGLLLPASFAVLVSVWLAQKRKDGLQLVGSALVGGGLLICVVAVGHALAGFQDAFGFVRTTRTLPGTYFGPLVNPNHVGTALILCLPVALQRALSGPRAAPASVLLVVATPLLLLATGARGAAVVAVLVGAFVAARERGWAWGMAAGALLLPVPLLVVSAADDVVHTLSGRWQIWSDALRTLADHWLLGVGSGGFEHAFEPYRTDVWRNAIAHAHSDPLEWIVETGALGAVALLATVSLAVRGLPRKLDRDREALLVGVVAVFLHALFEFPLAIPALALATVGVAVASWERRAGGEGGGRMAAKLLIGLAVFNGAAGLFSWHRAWVDSAQHSIRTWQDNPERAVRAAKTLEYWAPWRGWHTLHQAWQAERQSDPTRAARKVEGVARLAADDDELLRPAALVMARLGRNQPANELVQRAILRGPADYRNYVAAGRLACATGDSVGGSEAYVRAFERDAPYSYVRESWTCFPVALYWLDALNDHPGHVVAMGNLWIASADPQEALLAFDQAALVDERYADVPSRSRALLAAGKRDEAIETARARVERTGEAQARWVLGDVLDATGDPAGALEAWAPVREEFPGLGARVVSALARSEGLEAGLAEAERLRLLGKVDVAVDYEVVQLLADAGRVADCRKAAERLKDTPRERAAETLCAKASAPGE